MKSYVLRLIVDYLESKDLDESVIEMIKIIFKFADDNADWKFDLVDKVEQK
jgi:hypothetical protein